jgi:hypothetical protein
LSDILAEVMLLLEFVGGRGISHKWSGAHLGREQPIDERGTVLWILREIAVAEGFRSYQAPLVKLPDEVALGASDVYALVRESLEFTRDLQA